MQTLMGGLGLRPWEISELSSDQINHYVTGYRNDRKLLVRTMMDAGRLAGFMAVMPYLPKHVKRPSQVIKFDWDVAALSDMEVHTIDFIDRVIEQDKKDIESGRIQEGTKAYDEAIKRINKADGNDAGDITG